MMLSDMGKRFILIIFCLSYSLSNQQQSLIVQSSVHLTSFGSKFQPKNFIELLNTFSNVQSLLRCTMLCNQNRQCRTFDYDQSSLICRLFEGEFSTGTIINNSTTMTSRVGAIIYNTSFVSKSYSSYNQTCDQCNLGEDRYLQCINNTCQCPLHTYWNGQMCLNQHYNGSNCNSSTLSCRQDLNLTCSNETNSCIIIQKVCGPLTFQQPPRLYTTGSGPQSIISADFNKDTHLDLAVTNYNGHTISILLGIGNGSFPSSLINFASNGNNPYWLISDDLNRDGNIDLAICNEGSATIVIFLGFGNGSFQLPGQTFASGGMNPSSIVGVDLNKDNKTDLVITNTGSNLVSVFFGLGNGSFQIPAQSYTASTLPSSLTYGDFNGDGAFDLAVVSRSNNKLFIFINTGNGTFRSNVTSYTTGSFPYAVRTADINTDLKLDLVVANFLSNSISIFMGTGSGTFVSGVPPSYSTTSTGPINIAIADLNADSIVDLAISNQLGNSISIYMGIGNGTFQQGKNYTSMGQKLQGIIAQDLNADGINDLVVANQNNNTVAILLTECT